MPRIPTIRTHFQVRRTQQAAAWLTPIEVATNGERPGQERGLEDSIPLIERSAGLLRSKKSTGFGPVLARLDDALTVADWLAVVARPQGLRGAVLGTAATLEAEAERQGRGDWLTERCAVMAVRYGFAAVPPEGSGLASDQRWSCRRRPKKNRMPQASGCHVLQLAASGPGGRHDTGGWPGRCSLWQRACRICRHQWAMAGLSGRVLCCKSFP